MPGTPKLTRRGPHRCHSLRATCQPFSSGQRPGAAWLFHDRTRRLPACSDAEGVRSVTPVLPHCRPQAPVHTVRSRPDRRYHRQTLDHTSRAMENRPGHRQCQVAAMAFATHAPPGFLLGLAGIGAGFRCPSGQAVLNPGPATHPAPARGLPLSARTLRSLAMARATREDASSFPGFASAVLALL